MARFPSLSAWTSAFVSFLALNTIIPPVRAKSEETIQGTNAAGVTNTLLVDRTPALYTGNFGDCMGGQSLINLTSFDAAYYADNMTVLFNLAGSTSLSNESLVLYISVEACKLNFRSQLMIQMLICNRWGGSLRPDIQSFLCPLNSSVPIFGAAIIPVSQSDVSGIIPIALAIPDFEGSAILRIFSNATQTQIGCFQAVMTNGGTFSHTAAVGSVLGVFTAVALLASFATAIYGVSVPHIRTHYAHSLSVLVVFEVLQSIFFSGMLNLNWPSVLPAWWSNFAWSAGMIYTPSIIKSINDFTGVSGNSSEVGGAGSTVINTNGGLQQQIYGRSLERLQDRSTPELIRRGEELAGTIYKRAANTSVGAREFSWAGLPVAPGLPIPGNWSGFRGTLSDVQIPVADAFLTGFLWFLILIAILIGATVALKWLLEGFSSMKWIKQDRFALFRTHWLGFTGIIVLRAMFIAFFMMMALTLFQFSNGGKSGVLAIAVIVFLIFFGGALAVAFYACFYRVKFGKYESKPDRLHFQRKKVLKFIPWYKTVRESSMSETQDKTESSGTVSFFRIDFVGNDPERQSVHEDSNYIKRFGWLSARYRRTRWWFFAFWVVYQFVRACFIGGARGSPTAQVFGIFVWEVIAFIAIIRINPFEGARNTALAVYMLGISKIATAGFSIAFLPQYNVGRIIATVFGVIIIVVQGFMVIALLILIVLSAMSSYMSLTRNREGFKPHNLESIRMKYFEKIEKKATDLPPPPPPEPEEPKEPYFTVNTVRRAPKIEDEDVDFVPDLEHPGSQSQFSLVNRSRANSMRSHYSVSGNVPYGARVHRASWSSRDFQNFREEDITRANSPIGAPSRNVSAQGSPLNSMSMSSRIYPPLRATIDANERAAEGICKPEILTSRKYGVATVWLVATLGAKSNTKKVSKKAILDVNLKKACNTIMQPEAPMALRLQSNLLYGVLRVYDQQCGYVLSDAQAAQMKMRDLFKVVKNHDLDPSDAKARPDQLMLMDDPAFLPDMALPALDFDFDNLMLEQVGNSQRSSQSMLSVRNRNGSVSSHPGSGVGINLPSSSNHTGTYQLPFDDPFSGSSAQKAFGGQGRDIFNEEEENLYQLEDDMLFEFDADGVMRDIDVTEREARRAGAVFPSGQGRLESDSAASGRVRKEHEDAAAPHHSNIDGEGDFDMLNFGDEANVLPEAEAFSNFASDSDKINPLLAEEVSQEASSDSAEAPAKRRKPKQKKVHKDSILELRATDLLVWQKEYLAHMAVASVAVTQKKEVAQAKKNAEAWVVGNGLNGVGQCIGSSNLPSPLAMFSGAALLSKITRQPISEDTMGKKGTKRGSSADNEEEDEKLSASKRARQDDGFALPFDDEVGRGNFDDEMGFGQDSSSAVEIGREAPSALADYPSSAMPWNVSASLHSHQRGSSLPTGRGSVIAGSVRHMRSASPLIGRGSNIPGELDHFSSQLDDMVLYGRSDNESEVVRSKRAESFRGVSSSQAEFEIFGPAAQVDTQTATSSQWVKDALDRESGNFFEYVRNTIFEKTGDELGDDNLLGDDHLDELVGVQEGRREKFVTFEELFNPKQNSAMVAAQAFYHVLSLATKNRVWVEQEIEEDIQPFGDIKIGILA
ncbi:hypothetical protein D0Z07_1647 [Hyphodiscus hymeniophilus]|uniref:ML-like domain-containing protein n=1 Tax=Hyphodiscus hymeniophilus TaxID=353542 RepID=A0A9P6VNJ6_9HELO|nr:hypothetical protein D0Z07_1647 [Hyphodiscus hymeniophilus]